MSYSRFAQELAEFAKKERSIPLIREKADEIKMKAANPQEFLLAMGYAVHYAGNPSDRHILSRLMFAMDITEQSENALEVSRNAFNCAIPRLKPHVEKMVAEAKDVDVLVKDVMNAVRYAGTDREQSLILRLVEGKTRKLVPDDELSR